MTFVRSSAITFGQQSLAALCTLGSNIVLARCLGPALQGVYGVIFTTAVLATTLSNLGIGSATVYHVGRNTFPAAVAARQNILLACGLGSLGGTLLAVVLVWRGAVLLPHVPLHWMLGAIPLMLLYLLTQYLVACLQGAKRFTAYNVASLAGPCITLACTLVGVGLLGGGVPSALAAQACGQGCAALWAWALLQRPPQTASWRLNNTYARAVGTYGVQAYASNALTYLSYRLDVFLLNALGNVAWVGLYSVAVGVGERLWMVSFAASAILLPQVADGRLKLTAVVARHVLWLSLLLAMVLALVIPWALPLIFGAAYAQAVAPLWALLPGLVAASLGRVLANDIAGRGHPGVNAALSAATLALNVGGNLLLIGPYGAVGASLASTFAYTSDSVCKVIIYGRQSGTPWSHVFWPQAGDGQRIRALCSRAVS